MGAIYSNVPASEIQDDFAMMADCKQFNFIVWGVLGSLLCCFGFVGNILSLFAFQRDRRNSATTLLQCLASSDFVLLLSVFVTDALPYICDYTVICANPWDTWPYIRYIWILTPISHMCSIWFVVLIALNRYWAVCRYHNLSHVWNIKFTGFYVIGVLVLVVSFNLPRFFEYGITRNVTVVNGTSIIGLDLEPTAFGNTRSYLVIYKVMLVNILLVLLPLFALIVLTSLILRTLRINNRRMQARRSSSFAVTTTSSRSSSRPNTHNSSRRASQAPRTYSSEITLVLVMVVVVAIICQTPLAVFHFIRHAYKYHCNEYVWVYYLDNISKLLVNINSCVNFLIYCVFSTKFRTLLLASITCGRFGEQENGFIKKPSDRKDHAMIPMLSR